MATERRRDRRRAAVAAGRQKRSDETVPSLGTKPVIFFLLLPLLAVVLAGFFRFRHGRDPSPDLSVHERGLIKSDVSFREILAEHSRVSENRTLRRFPNPVLAYVTPWNSRGYEMAKMFSTKLTHVSPVWYELKSNGKKLVLGGRHNADVGWISDLKSSGASLYVLPRVVLEVFPAEFLPKKKQWSKAIDLIVAECKEMGYDGVVLESWSRWVAYGVLHDPDTRNMALLFIRQLGQALHLATSTTDSTDHLKLIYVIPAPRSQNLAEYDFGPQDLQELNDIVDGFSLMTYDFSGPQSPGPIAPLNWMRSSLLQVLGETENGPRDHARKIFLGINFYGNDFSLSEGSGGGGTITGRDYISLLGKHKPVIRWEETSAEHFFIYKSNNRRHAVFYPSLTSISTRLKEAQAWGAGLSIWEIGQGLDYFFDLL